MRKTWLLCVFRFYCSNSLITCRHTVPDSDLSWQGTAHMALVPKFEKGMWTLLIISSAIQVQKTCNI